MPRSTKRKREDQVLFWGVSELQAALERNEITLRRAELISHFRASQQRAEVQEWVNRFQCRTHGQAIAAEVIREQLSRGLKVDLERVASAIRGAIALASKHSC